MLFDVVRLWIGGDELVALVEIDADGKRIRLRRFVRWDTGEHLTARLERAGPPRDPFLNVSQRTAEGGDACETGLFRRHTASGL